MCVSDPLYIEAVGIKGCPSLAIMQFFLTLFKMPLTPPGLVDFFEGLCTALKMDKISSAGNLFKLRVLSECQALPSE